MQDDHYDEDRDDIYLHVCMVFRSSNGDNNMLYILKNYYRGLVVDNS